MLTHKQLELLKLLNENDLLTAEEIAKFLAISQRTVYRYVDIINDTLKKEHIYIEVIKGVGYQLIGDKKKLKRIMALPNYDDEASRIEKAIIYILYYEVITIDELATHLCLSNSSVNKMTRQIKERLEHYQLILNGKSHYGLSISGSELDMRHLLSDIGFNIQNNNIETSLIHINQKAIDVVSKRVFEELNREKIVVADRDIYDLMIKILVSISQVKQGHYIHFNGVSEENQSRAVIIQIMQQISADLNIQFSADEYAYVDIYSGFTVYDFGLDHRSVEDQIGVFVRQVLEGISLLSGIDYGKETRIIQSLSVHIGILLKRSQKQTTTTNPMLAQIKRKYPVEMNYAIHIAKKLHQVFGVTVNEDEIGYIAIHFGLFADDDQQVKKVAILCNYGVGTSQLVGEKIRREYPMLEVVGIYPINYLSLAIMQNVDLIISTVDIDDYTFDIPLVIVEDLLTDNALDTLDHLVESDASDLLRLFKVDGFYRLHVKNKQETLQQLTTQLIQKGLINESISQAVFEREAHSSTDIGNLIATPHTIFNGVHDSLIAVCILDEPILWEKEMVQLIFIICINTKDKAHVSVFRQLYQYVKDIKLVNRLIQSEDYQAFINQIKNGEKI